MLIGDFRDKIDENIIKNINANLKNKSQVKVRKTQDIFIFAINLNSSSFEEDHFYYRDKYIGIIEVVKIMNIETGKDRSSENEKKETYLETISILCRSNESSEALPSDEEINNLSSAQCPSGYKNI